MNVILDPQAEFTGPGLSSLRRDDHDCWHGRLGGLYVRWAGGVSGARATPTRGGSALAMSLLLRVPCTPGRNCWRWRRPCQPPS
ncbi:MAG TPA: hypothetical protein VKD66_13580 [Streptosporangiaceae bacterium]|nr:hypothetical protein [Streptosporangiaceae bacterium]